MTSSFGSEGNLPTSRSSFLILPGIIRLLGGGYASHTELRTDSKKLVETLEACNAEITNRRGVPDGLSHGFERDRSIITNAWQRKNRRFVLTLDLEEFFPRINFGRVREFLLKNRNFELQPAVATIIAQIETLSLAKDFDSETHYGKFESADQVVRTNFSTIDFSGFVPLLDRIAAVLKDYATRRGS